MPAIFCSGIAPHFGSTAYEVSSLSAMKKLTKASAVHAIRNHGILLVYPVAGKEDPKSLWSVAYPRSKMRWEWDENGDDRVATLWHLREQLSRSRQVVYAKWFQGRATFFSLEVFQALLVLNLRVPRWREKLSRDARELLDILEERSTQSTKELKRGSGLVGRNLESVYTRAMKELWSRNLIVAYGEVPEGAFPSLAVGATSQIFEDMYREALEMDAGEARKIVEPVMASSAALGRFYGRMEKQVGI